MNITIVQGAFKPVPPVTGGSVEKLWFDLGREFATGPPRLDLQTESARRLQGVHDVQIVRPGLGEILPGMGGGVHADKVVLPVGRCALVIVPLKRLAIVEPVVAEQSAARGEAAGFARHQPVPEIVPGFMAEVAEHGAIRLAHLGPHPLAHRIISFPNISRGG